MAEGARRTADRDAEKGGEHSVAFEVYTPFDPARLDDEIAHERGVEEPPGLLIEGNPAEASQDAPVTVWVIGLDVSAASFNRVITAHDPKSPAQGVNEDDLSDLIDKAKQGDDFTSEELRRAIRAYLLDKAGS